MTFLSIFLLLAATEAESAEIPSVEKHVLILGESARATDAVSKAQKLATQSGLPYATRGMILDNAGKLHWPADWSDRIYAGSYFLRRMDEDCGDIAKSDPANPLGSCITVEQAASYGLPGKGYVIVAGVVDDDEAKARLPLLRKKLQAVRDHVTRIYMGCIH